MVANRGGFTLIELMIALTVLMAGLLGLVGTSALVTQMLSRGDRAATASNFAIEQLEALYGLGCEDTSSGSATKADIYDLEWSVNPSVTGSAERVQLVVTYPGTGGLPRSDTLETSILCVR